MGLGEKEGVVWVVDVKGSDVMTVWPEGSPLFVIMRWGDGVPVVR